MHPFLIFFVLQTSVLDYPLFINPNATGYHELAKLFNCFSLQLLFALILLLIFGSSFSLLICSQNICKSFAEYSERVVRFIKLFTHKLPCVFYSTFKGVLFPIWHIASMSLRFLNHYLAILWFSIIKLHHYIFRLIRSLYMWNAWFWVKYLILKSCSASVERKEFRTAMVDVRSYFFIFFSMQSANSLLILLDIYCFLKESIKWSLYRFIIGLILTKDELLLFGRSAHFCSSSFHWLPWEIHHCAYLQLCCPCKEKKLKFYYKWDL